MGYHQDLISAAKWIASIQRDDGGWGLAPGQASSLVNTAEALYVLRRAGGFETEISDGLNYLQKNVFDHLKKRGARVRYVAFSLSAFADNRSPALEDIISKCCDWLEHAKNRDNGWGTEKSQTPSELFPTFLAIWSLQTARFPEDKIEPSLHWILSRATSSGWSIQPNHGPSYVATAYALLCLEPSKYKDDEKVKKGRDFLLQIKQWSMEEEVIAGTVWKHCPYAWAISALVMYDVNPYAPVIAEGIRYINSMKAGAGGWIETSVPEGKTVRAQYWAVMALDSVYRSFDPAIHVPRIDADIAQGALSEPEYVKIKMRTGWAVIVPARLYRYLAYALLAAAFASLMGISRLFAQLPNRSETFVAIGLLLGAWFLIRKRPKQFPTMARVLEIAVGFLAAVELTMFIVELIKNLLKSFKIIP